MFLEGVPLKVKLIGLAVLAVLIFSLVGTTLEAVNQAVSEGSADSQLTHDRSTSQLNMENADSKDDSIVVTLKYVCPFH